MKYTVELDWVSASELFKRMLIEDYNLVNKPDRIDNSVDKELLNALERVIEYYCNPSEYKEWKSSFKKRTDNVYS